jgi:hypothetical protein
MFREMDDGFLSGFHLQPQDNPLKLLKIVHLQRELKFIAQLDGYDYAIAIIKYQDAYLVENGEHQKNLNQG